MQDFKVMFYKKEDGTEPVKDFILGLDTKMRAKIMKELKMLAINGPDLRAPYSKLLNCQVKCNRREKWISKGVLKANDFLGRKFKASSTN